MIFHRLTHVVTIEGYPMCRYVLVSLIVLIFNYSYMCRDYGLFIALLKYTENSKIIYVGH